MGNWKMNLTVKEGKALAGEIKDLKAQAEVVVCPSFVEVYPVFEELKGSEIIVGAQNLSEQEKGAFTGEVSVLSFKDVVKYAIVGHSERRKIYGESDKIVAQKADLAARHGVTPVICVGETLHEREDGLSKVVVLSQVEASCAHLTEDEIKGAVIAYEPVWAIGTGHVCDKKDAETMTKDIRGLIQALYGEEAAKKVRVIYGGSVTQSNASDFAASSFIDGVLVGGASLNAKEFKSIVGAFSQ